MSNPADPDVLLRRIRFWIAIFMVGLVASGVTAFPLGTELRWMDSFFADYPSLLATWGHRVSEAKTITDAAYPFLAYGTDWLAFGHLVIAIVFVGAYRDPIRNKWLITFGLIACVGVIPLAFIAGPIREIPFYWRIIDSSFGIFGSIPLLICRRYIRRLEAAS